MLSLIITNKFRNQEIEEESELRLCPATLIGIPFLSFLSFFLKKNQK